MSNLDYPLVFSPFADIFEYKPQIKGNINGAGQRMCNYNYFSFRPTVIIVGQTKPNMRAITSDAGLCIVRVAENIRAISAQNLSKVQHVDHK